VKFERALPALRIEKSGHTPPIFSRREFSPVPFGAPFSLICREFLINFNYFSQDAYCKDFMAEREGFGHSVPLPGPFSIWKGTAKFSWRGISRHLVQHPLGVLPPRLRAQPIARYLYESIIGIFHDDG